MTVVDEPICQTVAGDEESFELGILYVHGIGSQEEGQPLTNSGSPLFQWFSNWTDRNPQLDKTVLRPSKESGVDRAFSSFSVEDGNGARQSVLMSESLWADKFDPPPLNASIGWLLGYGSWTALRHFCSLVRGPFSSELLRPLGPVAALVGSVVVVVPLQLLLILVYLLSLIPIKQIQGWVASVTAVITNIIGDSFVFTSNPLAQSAIVSKVIRDIDWLENRCSNLVIVAHSQGAAVAHQALLKRSNDRPLKFITYGSGIRKLFEVSGDVRELTHMPRLMRYYWLLVILGVIAVDVTWRDVVHVLSLPVPEMAMAYNPDSHLAVLYLLFVYMYFFVVGGWAIDAQVSNEVDEKLKPDVLQLLRGGVDWSDFSSSSDPVPDGPLLRSGPLEWSVTLDDQEAAENQEIPKKQFKTQRVFNARSVISDHTSYWRGADDFVARVAAQVCEWGGFDWLNNHPIARSQKIDQMSQMRGIRLLAKKIANGLMTAGTLALAVYLQELWLPAAKVIQGHAIMQAILAPIIVPFVSDETQVIIRAFLVGFSIHFLILFLYLRFLSEPLWAQWDRFFCEYRLHSRKEINRGTSALFFWLLSITLPLCGLVGVLSSSNYSKFYEIVRDPITQLVRFANSGWFSLLTVVAIIVGTWLVVRIVHKAMVSRYLAAE